MPRKKKLRQPLRRVVPYADRLPDAAYAPNGKPYARVRIALPENKALITPLYYREDGNVPWVETGYTSWEIEVWAQTYGRDYLEDIRNWDFYGEVIDIWEGNDPDYK